MIEFQVAAPGQIDEVLSVLNEATAWLRARGVSQWPERFDPSWVDGAILPRVGMTHAETLTRNSHALITPPTRPARTAGMWPTTH